MVLPQERQKTPLPSAAERLPLPVRPPSVSRSIDRQWLNEYEQRKDSIFNYYSIENEIDFLKKTEALPAAEKEFYVEENVKRFLGEFVGKIPYTTIPYMIHTDGFNYGGMHVMESYRKAAEMGGEREKAETAGFAQIEDTYRAALAEGVHPQTAVWISPPKIADYGFVFVMQPEGNGKVKEYIIRYDEKQEEVKTSNAILQHINPSLRYQTADEFLLHPQYLDPAKFGENLPALLQTIGVDGHEISRSAAFETAVAGHLGEWIKTYTDTIIAAAGSDPPPPAMVDQAKSLLLAIYSQAQRLKDETGQPGAAILTAGVADRIALGIGELELAYAMMQQSAPTIDAAGSCPVVKRYDGLPGDFQSFISNSDMLRALSQGQSLEDLIRNKSFPCPKCGKPIPAGEGKTECPHCHITKEQYAKEIGGRACD